MSLIEAAGNEPRYPERRPLPTRAQVNAIRDIDSLEDMRDEIDRRIAKIQTDLEFRDDTEEWERRAMAALSIHRYTANLIARRVAILRKGPSPFQAISCVKTEARERTECSALTWALIDGDVPETVEGDSAEEIDLVIRGLEDALSAAEADKADEVRRFAPAARDEAWLTEVNAAIRRARSAKHDLTMRKADLRKRAKMDKLREADRERERMFVDQARELLPPETYRMIWDRVDRMQLSTLEPTQ